MRLREKQLGRGSCSLGRGEATKYLAYDGFAYPMFRWTSKNSVEIDFNEASPSQAPVVSIFSAGTQQDATVIALKSGVENGANGLP